MYSDIKAVERTQLIRIALGVEAKTSYAVFGTADGGNCVDAAMPKGLVFEAETEARIPFQACDFEHLTVAHQLPTPKDERRFTAVLSTGGANKSAMVVYIGDGVYQVSALIPTRGHFTVHVSLGASSDTDQVVTFYGNAKCPAGRTPLPDGRCGCGRGSFFSPASKLCEACPARTSSENGASAESECSLVSFALFMFEPLLCIPLEARAVATRAVYMRLTQRAA